MPVLAATRVEGMPDDTVSEAEGARIEAVRALEAEFGELINRFRRLITENANRVSPGMLPGAYKVFSTIARMGSVSQTALGESLMADKSQISRTVRELEQRGLVQRTPDPHDGRSSILSLTQDGAERLEAARLPEEGSLVETLQEWSIDDIRSFTRLLHALGTGTRPRED